MSWRSVFIGNPARLSKERNQLCIEQAGEKTSVPLEDIGVVMVEERQVNISAGLLAAFGENKIPVFFCDEKHLPCTIVQPFHQHSRQKKILEAQLGATKPFAKNCWQSIVKQKIKNQAECLKIAGLDGSDTVCALAREVLSGDTGGKEAHAAKIYFSKLLFGSSRKSDIVENAALNYGYAILRGVIARGLAAYGLQPALGLHHSGELNPFNLADDLLEPFRPVVDLWVVENCSEEETFGKEMRQGLLSLLHHDVGLQNKRQTVQRAIDIACSQLAAAYLEKDPDRLALPFIIPLVRHKYE